MTDIAAAARQLGFLTYAMNQSRTPALLEQGPWGAVKGGYCAGLAIRWTALRYAASDYPYDRAAQVLRFPDWQATRDHNIYVNVFNEAWDSGKPNPFPEDFREAFAQYDLTLNRGMVTAAKAPMSGGLLLRAAPKPGCYFVVIAGYDPAKKKGQAHAVAYQNLGGPGWRFFDANFGAFQFREANEFRHFVDWYMRHGNYLPATRLGESCKVVGVNPPPFTGANFERLMANLTGALAR